MKLLYKRHKWQGRETWLGIELEEPIKDMMIKEGRFLIKIGEESYTKAGFRLSSDEARALRDALNDGLKIHDNKLRMLMNEIKKTIWESPEEKQENTSKPESEEPVTSFGNFMESGEKKEGDENYKLFKTKNASEEEAEFYY